jgi:hypothetical protein
MTIDKITEMQYTGYVNSYIQRTPKNIEEDVKKRLEESKRVKSIDTEGQTVGKHLDIYA